MLVTQSCLTLHDLMDCSPPGSSVHNDSPGKNTGVGCHALLQGVFPTKGVNVGLPPCRRILHHLSHKGSPRILEWVAYPFSRGSFQPWNQTRVSCIAEGFFTLWATREALISYIPTQNKKFKVLKEKKTFLVWKTFKTWGSTTLNYPFSWEIKHEGYENKSC